MKKEEFTKAVEEAKNHATNTKGANFLTDSVREMPLLAGDDIVLTTETGETNTDPKWAYFLTKDGSRVSFTQLLRRRNGLGLEGATNAEMLESLFSKFNDAGELALSIESVKQRESILNGQNIMNNYVTFKIK